MIMMILFVCCLICCLFPTISGQSRTSPYIINNADAQQIWASTFGGLRSAGTSSIAGGAIDPNDGSLVLTGGATGTFLGHDSIGDWDGFVIKMTPQGSLVWIRWFATVTLDYVIGAAIDLNGNIYITGYASAPLQGLPATTGSDVFVARLDPNGDQQWISSLSTPSSDKSSDIGVDIFGFCYVTWGHNSAVFLSKFHSNGTRLYSQNYAATSGSSTFIGGNIVEAQRGLSVINPIANVTNTVSIVVSFTVSNPLTYQYAQFTNGGGNDVIVTLVSASTGLPIWSRIYQTPADDIMAGIKSDSSGSIYVTGTTGAAMEGERYTGITNSNIFLSKLTFDGTKLWTVQYGAVTANVASQNLAVDNAGGVFVVGTNDQVQAFTMVDGYPTMYGVVSQAFAYPSILSKFDSDGFRLWTAPFCSYMPARTLGYYPQMLGRLVVVDPASGQIYVGGYKNGLYTGDVDVVPALPDAQINLNQAVVIGIRQPPANVSLAQWQTLLDQLSTLLATN